MVITQLEAALLTPDLGETGERQRRGMRGRIRRSWDALDAAPRGRRIPGTATVAVVALFVGLAASIVSWRTGWNMAYSDAESHLTIARRIIDSRYPGFQQLGTVWLPGPHLALMPFVQSLWLWKTGLAAGLTGALCLAISAAALYRITTRVGLNRAGRLTALAFFLVNPSVLYAYTTALTEPFLIAAILATFAGLAGWMTSDRKLSGGELAIFAGLPAAFAVLSRYEGWVLSVVGTVFVAFVSLRRWRDWRYSVRMSLSFAALPILAIVWWVSYNWLVFGSPLEFIFGSYSAATQQQGLIDNGALPTKGNLGLAVYTLGWSIIEAAGIAMLVLAALGALILTYTRGISNGAILVWCMGSTIVFQIVSLYAGQTAIQNDHSFPSGWWNNRFALSMLPLFAVLAGVLIDALTRATVARARRTMRVTIFGVVAGLLLAQNAWWLQDLPNRSAVFAEAVVSRAGTEDARQAAAFLTENYRGGYILIDETQTAVLPDIGEPLTEFVFRAAGEDFEAALLSPTRYAKWIVVNRAPIYEGGLPPDLVAAALITNPDRFASYRTLYENGRYAVLERYTS